MTMWGSSGITLCIVLASLISMMEGYDIGVMTNALLLLRTDLQLTDVQAEILVGSLNFVALVGSLLAGALCDGCGRRQAMRVILAVLFIGATIMSLSPNYALLICGRIVTGLGIGAGLVVVPVYVAELSPSIWRGRMVALIEVMINTGILLGYLIGWGLHLAFPSWGGSWRLMLGLGGIPPLVLAGFVQWLPDSPRWLMSANREEDAKLVLQAVHDSSQDVDESLAEIRHGLLLELECRRASPVSCIDSGWYSILFPTRLIRKMLLAACGVAVAQAAIGSSAIVYYTPQILSRAGFSASGQQMAGTIVIGATKTASVAVGLHFFDRAGRRSMLLLSVAGCSLCLLVLSMSLRDFQMEGGKTTRPETWAWMPLMCLCAYMILFSTGLGPGVSIVGSEVFPLLLRSRGLSVCAAANRVVSGVVAMSFLTLIGKLGVSGSFAVYGCLGIVGMFHIYITVPETKQLPLESILAQFSDKTNRGDFEEITTLVSRSQP